MEWNRGQLKAYYALYSQMEWNRGQLTKYESFEGLALT